MPVGQIHKAGELELASNLMLKSVNKLRRPFFLAEVALGGRGSGDAPGSWSRG